MDYDAKNIPLAAIDLEDATFLVSYDYDLEPLRQSIARIGLINPPVLRQRSDARYQIICGNRRIRALRDLGITSAACQLVAPGTSDEACLLLNLYDNTSHRELNPLEKSMAINRLLGYFPQGRVIRDFLPMLKIKPHISQLQTFQPLCLLEREIQDLLFMNVIDVRSALCLSELDPESRECLAQLLVILRLSVSKQAEMISSVLEIALRDGVTPKTVTREPAIQSILTGDKLNWPQKGDAILRHLREKRSPHLTAREKKVKNALKKANLPKGVSITPPPFFEDTRYCLSVYFTSPGELKERLESLGPMLTDDLLPPD